MSDVTLHNITKRFKDVTALDDVSFSIQDGEFFVLLGPTGAGKTTVINLLPRFYDVTAGAVLIDGYDVRDVTRASLRRQIGLVLQDTFLFSDTVLNNIRYGRMDASDEEVIAAAKLAHAHDFISSLPDGYHTLLGERGAGLSQGQRQLLAIARAALATPRLLILDDAHRATDPGRAGGTAQGPDELRHRPPAEHDPQRRPGFRH